MNSEIFQFLGEIWSMSTQQRTIPGEGQTGQHLKLLKYCLLQYLSFFGSTFEAVVLVWRLLEESSTVSSFFIKLTIDDGLAFIKHA